MIYCEGEAVWNGINPEEMRHNYRYTYQIEIPHELVSRKLGVKTDAVNASKQLPPGYIAVHPPEFVCQVSQLSVAA